MAVALGSLQLGYVRGSSTLRTVRRLHRACVDVNLIASNALLRKDPTTIHTNLMVIEYALSSGNAFLSSMSPATKNYRDVPRGTNM
jgi:hypothetical protein